MRHLFYITCYCGLLYSKSKEYINQTIYDISFLLEVFVDSLILETDTAVEHYTYLVCFLRVLAVEMLESTDLFSFVPQFLWWEDSSMIFV